MTKVLMDDSSLNAIANSIRRKNGLVRTYKPREMAPAIRAFAYNIPSAHDYTVTINQSDHQRIIVRKYLDPNLKEYTQSFTVAEPNYKLDISLEADAGWLPGTLNYQSPVTVDRDMIISATPATKDDDDDTITEVYVNGSTTSMAGQPRWLMFSDSSCKNEISRASVYGKVSVEYISQGIPITSGRGLFGWDYSFNEALINATELTQNIDTSDFTTLFFAFHGCYNLKSINISGWDTGDVSDFGSCFQGCSQLRRIDVSNWNTSSALSTSYMFDNCQYLQSLNLSMWDTSLLLNCEGMFNSCNWLRVIDISNWSTSQIERTFSLPTYLDYLIMDKEEIKFPNKIFGNNSRTKYLVPASMVDLYKEHPNWQSRASQIENIDNYTITRSGGEVWVSPNPY